MKNNKIIGLIHLMIICTCLTNCAILEALFPTYDSSSMTSYRNSELNSENTQKETQAKESYSSEILVTNRYSEKIGFAIETIDYDFMINRYPITQDEWKEVFDRNPSRNLDGKKPVERVSWYNAIAYCNKRSIIEGLEPCYSVNGVSDWSIITFSDIPQEDNKNWNNARCDFHKNGYRLPREVEVIASRIRRRNEWLWDTYDNRINKEIPYSTDVILLSYRLVTDEGFKPPYSYTDSRYFRVVRTVN